ncbi:succinyl-CoA synthetase subunit alpha [Pseudodesulfovibrio hydrargyri]|uniref:Succinyl-CoA synthetase subunit alpha n=1 Tax=Pseudodesulfovibrio hydrargyri TaxID=2125990 RepID=A0A1J5N4J6_9BACT|nr:CoA-binding protein [Pseudodesulfovibrio hydrargyri]OIQ50531.1 succinyl-CoA synthetase subunit alpha [Pseudodesulfovibrio hydrargyri]
MPDASINDFFTPRGVAIIGASTKKGSPNNQTLRYAIEMSKTGKVFPVHPKAEEIEGKKAYTSLLEIPDPVDLVVMAVGSKSALQVAQDVKTRRESKGDAGAVAIVTAGFKEMGTPEAIKLQDDMMEIMRSCGARVIGPNCQGIADFYNGVNTSFSLPPVTLKGGLSIVSQSGAFATSYLRWAKEQKMVGMNKFITLGNMADVDVTEILEYLGNDEKTKSIAMYLEGTPNARKLMEVAAKVTKKKPVSVLKAGRTAMGSDVAHSHTASIAGDDAIYDGAFKQAGMLRAQSIADFYHTGRVFDRMPLPKGNRICLLTVIGGPSTICVDALAAAGAGKLATFSESFKEKARAILAPAANVGAPDGYIDMTASVNPKMHTDIIKLIMEEDDIDAVLFLTSPPGFLEDEELANSIIDGYNSVPDSKKKPFLTALMAGNSVAKCRLIMEEHGMPTFDMPDEAARVMSNMIRYAEYRKNA